MAKRRRRASRRPHQRGFMLIALLALLALGGLYFLVSNLSPEFMRTRGQQQTGEALTQAREALIGYAAQYRDQQRASGGTNDAMYGFLPMPDMGTSRLNLGGQPASCNIEGCAMAFVNGAFPAQTDTVIGRFPWRTLGTGPLRDSHGECLWYAVSANFKSLGINSTLTMNWDTLSQLDIVVADGTAAMARAVASTHDRPIAVIFSPGPPLAGQDRSASATDDVTECGGNYVVSNYLDPNVVGSLGGVTNFFAGSTNGASGDTSAANKTLSAGGTVSLRGDGTLRPGNCPSGDSADCSVVANDTGVGVTSEQLFRTMRGSSYFRTDINAMLERMAVCLRDQIAAGTAFTPVALTGFTPASDKVAGRIPDSACYDDLQNPLGYFSHYRDQVFVAKRNSGNIRVALDGGASQQCAASLIFSSQRGTKDPVPADGGESLVQIRDGNPVSASNSIINTNWPANYLETTNLAGFTTDTPANVTAFAGSSVLAQVSASQTISQDIVRCIPTGASLTVVAPTVAASSGDIQLADYAPATGTLILGSADIGTNYGATAAYLSACAWTPETAAAGTGFRSYFRFRIRKVGEGFTFAVIDGDRNAANVCGAARQHLGYSGQSGNVLVPYIAAPKLAVEFDTSRQCNSSTYDTSGRPACTFTEAGDTLRNGRNDPCYTTGCWSGSPLYPGTKQSLDNSSHVAIVYWGYGSALTLPTQDDNVHDQLGLPMPSDPSSRPGPRNPAPVLPYVANPATIPGIAPLDRMGITDSNFAPAFREFHGRLELTRSFTAPVDPKDGVTTVQLKFWIEPHSAANISAMSYNAGSPPTLSVTTSSAHNLNTGDTVVIKDAVPPGYNGEFPITKIDSTHFTATLPNGTANPGRYISAITWTDDPFATDRATVTSANHGLNDWDTVTIAGAIPVEYNGTYTIRRLSSSSYYFGRELTYDPGDMDPAVAAASALTPRATALANTTRPMSELDATAKPLVADTATIYDEQKGACAASAPLCPNGQSCGSDNMCYQPSFRNLRLGFTVAERPSSSGTARGQLIEIKDRATTWLP
jgi:hypothetical protein